MYLYLSPLSSPVCEYSYVCICHETNESACNVESRPLNCWNSVSTPPRVELTADVFEIILLKTSTAERQPGPGASTPEPPPMQSKSGSKMREFRAEGGSSSQVSTAKDKKYRVMFCMVCGFRVRVWESYRTSRTFGYVYGSVTELTEVPGGYKTCCTRTPGIDRGTGRTELTEVASTGMKFLQNFRKFRVRVRKS